MRARASASSLKTRAALTCSLTSATSPVLASRRCWTTSALNLKSSKAKRACKPRTSACCKPAASADETRLRPRFLCVPRSALHQQAKPGACGGGRLVWRLDQSLDRVTGGAQRIDDRFVDRRVKRLGARQDPDVLLGRLAEHRVAVIRVQHHHPVVTPPERNPLQPARQESDLQA